jgi:uncharacterized protein YqgC (DUF456 family)
MSRRRKHKPLRNIRLFPLLVALLPAIYGVYCIVVQHAIISRRGINVYFDGWGAVAFGVMSISFGSALYHATVWKEAEYGLPRSAQWTALATAITLASSIVAVLAYYLGGFRM